MKRQIRRGVFETNSSSTHSITIMMKPDYEKFRNGGYLFCSDWKWRYDKKTVMPELNHVYTREEAIQYAKNFNNDGDDDIWNNEEYVNERLDILGFKSFDEEDDDDYRFETYCEEFTTPKGEEIVVFGYYGYDG